MCTAFLAVACTVLASVTLHAQSRCNWVAPRLRTPIPASILPRQFGCYECRLCVLGQKDVEALPSRGGSLGIKVVGSSHATIDNVTLTFKLFIIYDVGRTDGGPLARRGVAIAHVDTFAFNNEKALETYVRAKSPGDQILINFVDTKTGKNDERYITVLDKGHIAYDTKLSEFFRYEDAVQLARKQTVRALVAAATEIAPYILLYKIGRIESLALPNMCITLGLPQDCIE